MKPMYALHKDKAGSIMSAGSFSYDFEFSKFLRDLDIRPGDSIEFGEALKRDAEVEATPEEPPAFIETAPAPVPAHADAQPF